MQATRPIAFPDSLRLLRPKQAAEMLGVHVRTLRTLAAKGAIPCVKIGRLPRYRPDDLRRWIDKKTARE